MSKRFILPQQHGERKKAKLDVSISDHNFPLSQNKDAKTPDNWGDDNDDEILLLASQACEDAFINNDHSSLPDYSLCMQPRTTSTQMYEQPGPSSSKNTFKFKKPANSPLNTNCRISSPLPGMVSKVNGHFHSNNDDFLFDDKIFKNHDSEQVYRQLLQLQEENSKLKSENGKLLEKCVTKEGEASILRTQLKSCQVAVDNARLEKIKAQEKAQIEWTDKFTAANGQIHDLRTQLDFKNLEIISVKEKCRMLESNKVKLTQVNVATHDISSSHRNNHANDFMSSQRKPQKMITSAAQTDSKEPFLTLNKTVYADSPRLSSVLPLILEHSTDQSLSLLEYNEKLQRHSDYSQNKCRIYSTFHRIPSTPVKTKDDSSEELNFATVYENVSHIANGKVEDMSDKYLYIFRTVKRALVSIQIELQTISQRVTTAFQKEMDEKYIEATSKFIWVDKLELLKARFLYKEEQAILARRMTAILFNLIDSHSIELFHHFENTKKFKSQNSDTCIDIIGGICSLLDSTSCALLYSGLLLAIICLLKKLLKYTKKPNCSSIILDLIKIIITSRPMPFVSCRIVNIIRILSSKEQFHKSICPGLNGNLKVDYDQGVLLYRKDSCCLQVLYKQIETTLKCIEKQNLQNQLSKLTEHLMAFYNNINCNNSVLVQDKNKCNCYLILMQIIVYALRICAVFLNNDKCNVNTLLPLCRSGIHVLYQCTIRDVEFSSQLSFNEGHYIEFCEIMKKFDHPETYNNMLSDLLATFQSSPEDLPGTFHNEAWVQSFENFTVTD